jgi:hypothetical protein
VFVFDEHFPKKAVKLEELRKSFLRAGNVKQAVARGFCRYMMVYPLFCPSRYCVGLSPQLFLKARLNDQAIDCVSMAFHAGAAWRRDSDKLELLRQIFERNIRLRILVNSGEAAEAMCAHMKQPMKRYTSIGDSAKDWQDLAEEHPDLMEVRVTGTPIMHRIYMAQGSDGTGMIDVKYYTYGNFRPDKDFRLIFEADTPEFRIYQEEFEYLWKNAGTQDT